MAGLERRPTTVFCDIDNTQNHLAPPPMTGLKLFAGKFSLPPEGHGYEPSPPKKLAAKAWSIVTHAIRPLSENSRKGLEIFRQTADQFEMPLKLAVLSGRDEELHHMTHHQLQRRGRMNYYDEVRLNTVKSSGGFKEHEVEAEAEKGNLVVLVEDDIMAALRAARINDKYEDLRILVFLLKNVSNAAWLRRRGKVELPSNVIMADSFKDAALKFRQMVEEGII